MKVKRQTNKQLIKDYKITKIIVYVNVVMSMIMILTWALTEEITALIMACMAIGLCAINNSDMNHDKLMLEIRRQNEKDNNN